MSSNNEKVWSKFSVTKQDGSLVTFRIQDMPTDRFEDVMDFNVKYFVMYETFYKAAGVNKNPEALKECREFVSEMFRDPTVHTVICCRDDQDTLGDILGVSTMGLMTKDEHLDMDDLQLKTKELNRFFELLEVTHNLFDVMGKMKVDKSYDGRGIAVHPDYKGLGIATEFCKVRRLICKEHDVPITTAWMTSLGSQKAAERAGWGTAFQITFEDLAAKIGGTMDVFDGAPPYCKLMFAGI